LVKTVSYRIAPLQTASLVPMPMLVPVPAAAAQPTASQTAVHPQPAAPPADAPPIIVASAEPTATAVTALVRAEPGKPELGKSEPGKSDSAKLEVAKPAPAKSETAMPAHARSGWLIQIGAFDGEDEAKQHLSAAQIKVHATLAAADPFTERVQKGDKALFRARFAGFDKTAAEAACKQLKHNDFECMAVKN
jgi:D-alanyl-D-alanine carboxypeptidase